MTTVLTIPTSELELKGLVKECMTEVELSDMPRVFLELRRNDVIEAYMTARGMTRDEVEKSYEGGIDMWCGFGSVTCFELGGGTLVGYGFNEIQMVII
jgi:hypothetical protein